MYSTMTLRTNTHSILGEQVDSLSEGATDIIMGSLAKVVFGQGVYA